MSCSRPAENLVELPSASSDTINAERSGWRKPVQTQIVIRNAEQSNGLRAFAEEKFAEALARFEQNVMTAVMRLEDITGPDKETGRDKLCSLHVKLRTGDIVIKQEHTDFRAAIDVALDRLKVQLGREIGRAKRGIAEG